MKVYVREWMKVDGVAQYVEHPTYEIGAYEGLSFTSVPTESAISKNVVGRVKNIFLSAKEDALVVYIDEIPQGGSHEEGSAEGVVAPTGE